MGLLQSIFPWVGRGRREAPSAPAPAVPDHRLPNEEPYISTEKGLRTTPENQLRYMYRLMWVDQDVRQAILDVREMDRLDGRVKRIHSRVARDTIKGGLVFTQTEASRSLEREWDAFARRLQLNRVEKLRSDARGFVMEGNLPIQWVLDTSFAVVSAVRMASETIFPDVRPDGRFRDVREAYVQLDVPTGAKLATFPLWQLFLARFDPDNFDDLGAMGRPFLDATRTTWRKLGMTEEDMVIRRRVRAPLRMSHVLEGATKEELDAYRTLVEQDQHEITTDYYLNRKGAVTSIQGDAKLNEIDDIVHLLDSFFAGSPLPKGLMGYAKDMQRDILEDLKRDYYEEVDAIQDTLSFVYEAGFRLHLLLKGINPDASAFAVTFAERRTETPNQLADRALKWQALGMPRGLIWEERGFNAGQIERRREWEAKNYEPYPDPDAIGADGGRVSITPGNQPKGESATSITNG